MRLRLGEDPCTARCDVSFEHEIPRSRSRLSVSSLYEDNRQVGRIDVEPALELVQPAQRGPEACHRTRAYVRQEQDSLQAGGRGLQHDAGRQPNLYDSILRRLINANPRLLPGSDCWATRKERRDGRDRSIGGYQRRAALPTVACARNSAEQCDLGLRVAQIGNGLPAHLRQGPQAHRATPENGVGGGVLGVDQTRGTYTGEQLSSRCLAPVAEYPVDTASRYVGAPRDEPQKISPAGSQSRAARRHRYHEVGAP